MNVCLRRDAGGANCVVRRGGCTVLCVQSYIMRRSVGRTQRENVCMKIAAERNHRYANSWTNTPIFDMEYTSIIEINNIISLIIL